MSYSATGNVAAHVRRLAQAHHVTAERDTLSQMASTITQLADDVIELDVIEQLLVNLKRKGILTKAEILKLQGSYLQEKRDARLNASA